jgi:hypothetical protein
MKATAVNIVFLHCTERLGTAAKETNALSTQTAVAQQKLATYTKTSTIDRSIIEN